MHKFFQFFLLVVVGLGSTLAQAQNKHVEATIDFARFKATDTTSYIEFYCAIDGNSVVYKNLAKDKYQAEVALHLEVSDSAGVRYYEKLMLKSPELKDTKDQKPIFKVQKRVLLRNGNYQVAWRINDINSKTEEVEVKTPVALGFNNNKVQLSDIQLLESFTPSTQKNDYSKHGYSLISYVSDFYPKGMDKLPIFTEIYHADKVAGAKEPLVIFYSLQAKATKEAVSGGRSRQEAAPVNLLLAELDLSVVPSGNYELVIDVRDKQNKSLAVQRRFIQRSNPDLTAKLDEQALNEDVSLTFAGLIPAEKLSDYLLAHYPVANTAEQGFIETLARSTNEGRKRSYIYHFWRKRNGDNAETAWLEYKKRIDYVDQKFSNRTFKGYESDRGRVFLQYGPPNQVHNERTDVKRPVNNSDSRPYEIWHYYSLENQTNREFVFIQRNLGNNNYDLLHSNARGEISNPNWRNDVAHKFSGNKEFDRNATNPLNE
ncbi:MAG: GWxTD domain-containing protein [Hymenobacteraceae bacterium]|nr:GWxTD domain-containing protein [Hymenobacteraceae bacterium]MDX5395510.1 GWxTD domain-containing protein [Hymenobacteraceae bacterium]MDX5511564.1 GWxTD domain-containing protein [Hymenobacteraceae bacterium]